MYAGDFSIVSIWDLWWTAAYDLGLLDSRSFSTMSLCVNWVPVQADYSVIYFSSLDYLSSLAFFLFSFLILLAWRLSYFLFFSLIVCISGSVIDWCKLGSMRWPPTTKDCSSMSFTLCSLNFSYSFYSTLFFTLVKALSTSKLYSCAVYCINYLIWFKSWSFELKAFSC